jgi:hypothetical protein
MLFRIRQRIALRQLHLAARTLRLDLIASKSFSSASDRPAELVFEFV